MLICPSPSANPNVNRPQRRVLIVSPHFPPTNAPDHQRIRVALPYLQKFGWEAQILTVQPDRTGLLQDPLLAQTLPSDLQVTQTEALTLEQTRKFGLGNLGWRCLPFLLEAGDNLLASQSFDLVFFSTTVFPVMALGRRWWHQFGVPYVLDFQDPWRSDYHGNLLTARPPGGRLKYGITQITARLLEPYTLKTANQIISVSPAYPQVLQNRYSWLHPEQFTVLPFGAPEPDFELLKHLNLQQSIFDPQDGKRHWVYVGRGGADMSLAVRSLFLAIQTERNLNPKLWQSIHLHFIGTSYASGNLARPTIAPLAAEYGLADLVTEYPHRIPYFEAQQLLLDSDGILLLGSDDPGYTASKLYPCVLAQKPILGIFHQQSSVVEILRHCQAGEVVTFQNGDRPESLSAQVLPHLQSLAQLPRSSQPATDWEAFQPYTGREMTRKLCQVFDRALTLRAGG